MSELDSTKARLRLLEQNVVNKDSNKLGNSSSGKLGNSVKTEHQDNSSQKFQQSSTTTGQHSGTQLQQQQHQPVSAVASTTTTSHKSENHRVHFDLNNATSSSSEIRKPARTSRPNGANVATRTNNVHLPSDARQKLEQLVI